MTNKEQKAKYPGKRDVMDGNTAVIMCERESSDGAGAYPITPSTQMGEYWAAESAKGHVNISGKPLIIRKKLGRDILHLWAFAYDPHQKNENITNSPKETSYSPLLWNQSACLENQHRDPRFLLKFDKTLID